MTVFAISFVIYTIGIVLVSWAFTSGASAYWILPGVLIGYVFNWVVLVGPLRDQTERLGAITLPDYLSFRLDCVSCSQT